ncbi:hypothetical protein BDZ89DRAFT_1059095, partial [Hymenopellis radicata]
MSARTTGRRENPVCVTRCPGRSRLINARYLSAEQRLNYLASVDSEGKLRWARNNELIDTTAGHWKDSGDGKGVIPEDSIPDRPPPERRGSFSSSLASQESVVAQHYAGDDNNGRSKLARVFHQYFTFLFIRRNRNFPALYILAGGLVTSAGLISVKDGVIYTLSPLSGHYRRHFHRFIKVLNERGVDMHKARISKAGATLWGIEHLAKWKKSKDVFVGKGKKEIKGAAQKVQRATTSNSEGDGDDSSWKKHVLLDRERKKAEQDPGQSQPEATKERE